MERKLYKAIISGNVQTLTSLLDKGLNILEAVTPTGNTALHLAAYHGHLEAMKMFLQVMKRDIEAGNQRSHEFVSAKNEEGNTALHEAAIGGHYKVVEFLLEHHSDLVDITNLAGETALFKAIEEGHKQIVNRVLPLTSSPYDRRTSDGQTLVQCAIYNTRKGVLKILIDKRPDLLKQVDNLGRTPLHNAAYVNGISNIAKILLEKDSSLCYKVDNNHQSALHIAVKEGNLDLVTEILNYAEDCIEIVDNDGRTALHLAVEHAVQTFDRISRRIKSLVMLVTSRRVINKPDKLGKTALDIAMDNMHKDERLFYGIKMLLERNGARRTTKKMEETKEPSLGTEKSTWNAQIISVNAVLIATVAFAAPFTLPKDNPNYAVFFRIAVICDTLAFCSSISSAVLLMYALHGKQEDPLLLNTSLTGLWIALISLLLAFGASIYELVAPSHRALAGTLLVMVSIVPICIRIMIFRSKKYIFTENEHHLWIVTTITSIPIIFIQIGYFTGGTIVMINTVYIFTGLMLVWIGVSICRQKFFHSKRHISRDNGHYIWFTIIAFIVTILIILVGAVTTAEFGKNNAPSPVYF